jgi:hypothetical protein
MTEDRRAAIVAAITTLKAEGKKVTENAVLALAGGSRTNSRPLIRQVMAELAVDEGSQETAVTPAPGPAVAAVVVEPPTADPDVFYCVVVKPFCPFNDGQEVQPGTILDVGAWRQTNLAGLITGRYLRPHDPDLDAPPPRPVVEPPPAVPEVDPADPHGVKAAQEELARCMDEHTQACATVDSLLTAVCAVAGKYGDWQRAVDLGWAFFVQERDRAFRQEGEAVGTRYAQACEMAQQRGQAVEAAREALQAAEAQAREAEDRAFLAAHHPHLLEELDREQARLRRISQSEPGSRIAQRDVLRQVEATIRAVLAERRDAVA